MLDEKLASSITSLLETIQQSMFEQALDFRESNTFEVASYDEFKSLIDKGFIVAHWDGTEETEAKIKEETKATIRVLPETPDFIDRYSINEPGACIYSGKPSKRKVVFAKSY